MDTQLEEVEDIESTDVQPEVTFPEGEEEEPEISEEHRQKCYKTTQDFLRAVAAVYEKQNEKVIRDISNLQAQWAPAFNFMEDLRCRYVLDREVAIMATQASEIGNRAVKTGARIQLYDYQQSLFDQDGEDGEESAEGEESTEEDNGLEDVQTPDL